MTMEFGAQLWSQHTTWPEFRDAALAAEAAGWDSVWTWDHLLAIFGPWEQPILEGWTTLCGRGGGHGAGPARADGRREHVPQPGPDGEARDDPRPRLAAAGRCSGSAAPGSSGSTTPSASTWGSGVGERLDRLDESVMLLRRLLDGERIEPTRAASTRCATPCASRARSRPSCRS